jgi:hypothetical protein
MHYEREKRHGNVETTLHRTSCEVDGCPNKHKADGLCTKHYARRRVYGTTEPYIPDRRPKPNSHGYVRIYAPELACAGKDGWVPEHRAVMERLLGRPLRAGENVHHRNGVRSDNRPENLELWIKHQPNGGRVDDVLAWAREIVALYG